MTTEQLPPIGGGDGPIWDRPPPPPPGNGGKIALAVGLLVVVALLGLGIGWMFAAFGGSGGSGGGATSPSAGTTPSSSPSTSTTTAAVKGSEIEAGRTTDFGYFLSAKTINGVTHITFDRAQLLVGKAANDYAKAHHMQTPVPNDYLLLNVNPKTRDLVLGPQVTVTGTTVLANSSQPVPVSLQTLLAALPAHGKQMPLDVKYDSRGFVTSVAERFFP